MATEISSSPTPRPSFRSRSPRIVFNKSLIFIILGIWGIMVIFPMLWSVMSAFKTDQEIFFSPWSFPAKLMFDNFVRALTKANIALYLVNSLKVILPAIFFTLLFSAEIRELREEVRELRGGNTPPGALTGA